MAANPLGDAEAACDKGKGQELGPFWADVVQSPSWGLVLMQLRINACDVRGGASAGAGLGPRKSHWREHRESQCPAHTLLCQAHSHA